jgi:uncharacterized protein (TIGR02271 family)
MTTQAEELLGAQVTGADGKVVGTVEQVFRDDVDGTPAWARVRSGKTGRFVPLGSSQVTRDGLSVPYDTQKIMGGPNIDAGQHMSASQAEDLSRYYGLTVPTQQAQGQQTQTEQAQGQQTQQMQQSQPSRGNLTDEEWLVRQEERLQVGKEMLETGRIRLHRYVDVEPVEQAVHVFHEEYDIERMPVNADERTHDFAEAEQEIILHEERAVLRKELVPVERVRLIARRVEEDKAYRDELRRERIEIEPEQQLSQPGIQSDSSIRKNTGR